MKRRPPPFDPTRFDWPRPQRKEPAPTHGIKVKKAGVTWWGQRWIDALVRLSAGFEKRLERGRSYARAGRAHDLVVVPGRVRARVTGSRREPYAVTIGLAVLSDDVWQRATSAMAERAQFAARLLSGEMPEDIEDAFRDTEASLFPARESDLTTECSCPDWANPCKHVAATHYVLAEAFDLDPFLLFELRGRSKERVLDALRSARAGGARQPPGTASDWVPPTVSFENVDSSEYDEPREPLPALELSFEEPAHRGTVLRQLGAPAVWRGETSPADWFDPLVRAAAARARALALGSPDDEACPAHDEPKTWNRRGAGARSLPEPSKPSKPGKRKGTISKKKHAPPDAPRRRK